MPRRKGIPLVQAQMRLPEGLLGKIDKAAATWGKKPNRTATTIRLIEDGFKWWAREDLEQDTTLGTVMQMHDRLATVLAMQNAMALHMGLMEGEAGERFMANVASYKAAILQEGSDDGPSTVGKLDGPGDDDGGGGLDEDAELVSG